jgi:hypothetical protein
MIPKKVEADELLIKAKISDWLFQLLSTNWTGYWIVQLSNSEKSLPILIDLNHLIGFCNGLKKCIDAHSNPNYVAAKITSMIEIIASNLPTPFNDEGSISITSNWESDPFITLNFYNNQKDSHKLVIRQSLYNADAMDFYNLLAGVYNSFPDKSNWEPRQLG